MKTVQSVFQFGNNLFFVTAAEWWWTPRRWGLRRRGSPLRSTSGRVGTGRMRLTASRALRRLLWYVVTLTPFALLPFPHTSLHHQMQNTGTSVMRVIVELHQDGLYYISDAEIEFLLDEANLDGRINRQYEDV